MAVLKDTLIQGSARVTDTLYANKIQGSLLKTDDLQSPLISLYTTINNASNTSQSINLYTNNTLRGHVGISNSSLGIYSTGKILLRPGAGSFATDRGIEVSTTAVLPYSTAGTGSQVALGATDYRWNGVYSSTGNFNSATASTSSTTGALVVGGGIGTGAASYLTGSVHIKGSAGSNALIVRGISGSWDDGNRGDPTTDPEKTALYLNLNNGPIYLGGVSATATDAIYMQYTQDASSSATGAVRIGGGLGVAKKIYAGSTISAPNFIATHTAGGGSEFKVQYSSTISYWWGVGTANENHGLYDDKANKWIILASAANTWSFDGNAATATKATQDGSGNTITNKYFQIYNTSYQGNSSAVTVNDLAKQGPAYGMINHATDNPIGSATWVHVLNMGWSKANTSWIGQIALHTDGTTMYFRGNGSSAITGKAWNTVLSSNNYSSYAVPLSGGTMTGALNLPNNTWNKIGDDAQLGDINKGGHIGIQGINGNTGIFFTTYNQTTKTTGGAITWDGTKFSITSTTAIDASISGNAATAATATKLGTATIGSSVCGIYLNSGTATALSWYPNYVSLASGNKSNFPWHRIATTNLGTSSWVDKDAILFIRSKYDGGHYGILKVSARANNATTSPKQAVSVSAKWIVRYGFAQNDVRIAKYGLSGESAQCDVYVKCAGYMRAQVYFMEGSNAGWTLIASNEVNDTTTTDKKTSVEVYNDVSTTVGAITYDTVVESSDGGNVNYANSAGSATTATTASNLTNFKVTTTANLGIDAPGANAIGYVSGLTKANWNYQQTDGSLYTQFYNASWISEIFQDYRTGQLSVRGKNNGTWQSWRRILDETNGATILGLSNYRANTQPKSGAWFAGTPVVGSDGVTEVGKYIDFHSTNTGTSDFDARITATTSGLTLSGTTTGTFSGSLSGNATNVTGTVTYQHGGTGLTTLGGAGQVLKVNSSANGLEWGTVSTADEKVKVAANITTAADYPVVFANSNKSTTAAETAGLNKSGTKFYFNPSTGLLTATQVANAIWNDYAEYRKQLYTIQPGYVIKDTDSGYIVKANERLIPGAQIVSDTWGHSMGKTDECQTPVAVAGRVLAYTYRSREQYHAGMAVCSAPGGTIDIMTREEIRDYPDAIIGIVSEIPDYEEWGSGKVKVDGRIWIKVR